MVSSFSEGGEASDFSFSEGGTTDYTITFRPADVELSDTIKAEENAKNQKKKMYEKIWWLALPVGSWITLFRYR